MESITLIRKCRWMTSANQFYEWDFHILVAGRIVGFGYIMNKPVAATAAKTI